MVVKPLPVPGLSVGVGGIEGVEKVADVHVRVLAAEMQAHGVFDEGLYLPRGL
jgi:hypothetical protein